MVDPKDLKRALVAAGLEVFRTRGEEIHLAERQNVSLMEAGVRVRGGAAPGVIVVARAQRSDALAAQAEQLFDLVRARSASLVEAGFLEVSAAAREIRSVSDPAHVVDTWFEVTFQRDASDLEGLVGLARLAIRADRYVVP
ncbi:MAG: hypothetical protein U0325_08530 [Polyangiales bacterium]